MSSRRQVGRYTICDEIASGGMAKVYLGRLRGPVGFARTVAIKGLHPGLTEDPQFVAMLLDEAHLASKVRHPNVVSILDVVWTEGELFLVLEYVHGMSLSRLLADDERLPPGIAVGIATGILSGLHAAHEATGEMGEPLAIVHRDVSPQNIMVGVDGVSRVLDFGIAKATSRAQSTMHGQVKGKVRYMAPEQLRGKPIDRRADVFAASVVLWEMLTGRRLFDGDDPGTIVAGVLTANIRSPSEALGIEPSSLDEVVLRGLAKEPADRYATARDMERALESAVTPATPRAIGEWVERTGGDALRRATERLQRIDVVEEPAPKRAEDPTRKGAIVAPEPTVRINADDELATVATKNTQRTRRVSVGVVTIALLAGAIGVAYGARDRSVAVQAGTTPTIDAEEPPPPSAEPSHTQEPVAPPKATARMPARRWPPPKAKPSASPACDPPYTIVNGIKRFKPECI